MSNINKMSEFKFSICKLKKKSKFIKLKIYYVSKWNDLI